MGQVQGRVFDSSTYAWVADVAVSLSATGYATTSYVDASLAERDSSIAFLNNSLADIDTSIGQLDSAISLKANSSDVYSKTYIDGSLNAKADISAIPTDFYSQAYVDGSLNAKADISAIPTDFYSQAYVDGSLASRDTSIAWLDANKLESADLAGYATTAYVDGSLATKQDIIPNGTFLKEASIGYGLEWNAGALDVSIVIPSGAQDPSILSLYDYVDDLSTYTYSHSHAQDSSITDLYNTKQNTIADGTFVKEASLGDGLFWVNGSLDVSVEGGSGDVTQLYVDGSLGARDTSIAYLNTNTWKTSTALVKEASLGFGLFWVDGDLDVSVAGGAGVSQLSLLTDVSIDASLANDDVLSWDSSIGKWTNQLVADLSALVADASLYFVQGIGTLGKVDVSSIGTAQDGSALIWKADISTWTFGVAGGGAGDVTKAYVDGSLGLRDTSIGWLNTNKLGITAKLDDIADVSIGTDVSTYHVLVFRKDGSIWENKAPIEAATYFPELVAKPDASSGTGTPGQISYDASYFYICTSTNKWGRTSLSYAF